MSVPAFLFSMIVYPYGFSSKSQEFSYESIGGVVLLFWIWSIFGSGSKLGNDSGSILVDLGPSWFSMLVTVFAFWSSMRGYIWELFWQAQGLRSLIRVCWVPFILLVRIWSGFGFGNGSALHWEESRFGPIPVNFSPD